MSDHKPKQKISVTFFGLIKVEAEGLIGLSSILIIFASAIALRWMGLF